MSDVTESHSGAERGGRGGRRDPHRTVWVAVFLLTGFVAVGGISQLFLAREAVTWRPDWEGARAESARTGRPVFAYFTATWCGPCQRMRRTTWSDPKVAEAIEARYVPVKVDIDAHPELARAHGVESIPTYGVIDAEGRWEKRGGGAIAAGEFLEWLSRPGR